MSYLVIAGTHIRESRLDEKGAAVSGDGVGHAPLWLRAGAKGRGAGGDHSDSKLHAHAHQKAQGAPPVEFY